MPWKPALAGPTSDPIWKRIDASVRGAIDRGTLRPGDRLPSVADVATGLRINKLTVVKAFRGLEVAGLVSAHVGRGTFVSDGRPVAPSRGSRRPPSPTPLPSAPAASDSTRALRRVREGYAKSLRDLIRLERKPGTIDLVGGVPSTESVDERLLERLTKQVLAKDPRRLYGYGGESGLLELRRAVAAMLARSGIHVDAEQVLITNGSQQAASLVAAWARDEERGFIGETPTFIGTPQAFLLFGHSVATVPWSSDGDDDGIDIAALRAVAGNARTVLHTCPDFQNPTGRTMSPERRREIVAWVKESDAVVMEDAIARDLRFEGESPESLFSQLPPGRRILVGSVSKSFMTGLRVGYLVADAPLIEALRPFKRAMDLGSPSLVQAVAAAFLDDGYEAHLKSVRATYREHRDALVEALAKEMPKGTVFTRPSGGFQLWVTLPDGTSSVDLFLRGLAHGVAIGPGPIHDIDGRFSDSFRCGYGRATPDEIREGVRRIARAHADLRARGTSSSPGTPV